MARILTITGEVKLPDDEFDAAGIVTKAKAGIDAAASAMSEALGVDGVSEVFAFDVKIGKQRRARKVKAAGERRPRTPRTPVVTNGNESPAA